MELIRAFLTLVWILARALIDHMAWMFVQRGAHAGGGRANSATHPRDYRPRHLVGAGRHHH